MDGNTILLGIGGLAAGAVSCIAAISALGSRPQGEHQVQQIEHPRDRGQRSSHRGQRSRKGSNTIALDARKIALHAEARGDRNPRRLLGRRLAAARYLRAHQTGEPYRTNDVKATVSTRGGSTVPVTAECVRDDGDTLVFEFPTVRADFHCEDAQRSRMRHISCNTPGGCVVAPPLRLWFVDEHITWADHQPRHTQAPRSDGQTNQPRRLLQVTTGTALLCCRGQHRLGVSAGRG